MALAEQLWSTNPTMTKSEQSSRIETEAVRDLGSFVSSHTTSDADIQDHRSQETVYIGLHVPKYRRHRKRHHRHHRKDDVKEPFKTRMYLFFNMKQILFLFSSILFLFSFEYFSFSFLLPFLSVFLFFFFLVFFFIYLFFFFINSGSSFYCLPNLQLWSL